MFNEFVQKLNPDFLVFLAIIFPGIVAMFNLRLCSSYDEMDWKTAFFQAAFWGTLNFVLVTFLFWICGDFNGWILPSLSVLPLVGPPLLCKVMFRDFYRKRFALPFRTAFDHALAEGCLGDKIVYVHMQDGTTISGFFQYPDSFGTTSPNSGDLYLSHAVERDESGKFYPKPQTAGLLIKGSEWSYLEMFEIESHSP